MKKKLSLWLLFLAVFMFSQTVPSPTVGDFRSATAAGNWTSSSTWQVYNGSTWVAANSYPGQGTTSGSQGNYRVFIMPGTNVTVNSDQTYYFGDVYVLGSPRPGPTTFGQVTLSGNGTELRLLGNEQSVFILGGIFRWASNNTVLYIKTGSSIVVRDYNGIGTSSGYGTNGVQPEQSANGCTGNQQIKFVDSNGNVDRMYAVCNGSNSDYNFHDLNVSGGSLYASLSLNFVEICSGGHVQIVGDYLGFIPVKNPPIQVKYKWLLVSAPAGYVFPEMNFTNVPVADLDLTLTIPGTYEFSLRVQYLDALGYEIYSVERVIIQVDPAGSPNCACYKDPLINPNIQVPSKVGITSLGRAGSANSDNWPMNRQSADLVLESKTKGFVINRVSDTSVIAQPVEGMMVYDESSDCLKIYSTKDGGATFGWDCYNVPACP